MRMRWRMCRHQKKIEIPPAIAANVEALYALPAVKAFKAAEGKAPSRL